jgi:hypothetical protein
MRPLRLIVCLLPVLALMACGGPAHRSAGIPAPLECVPFARALSGIDIRGNAAEWWYRAGGRYEQGNQPEVGSVMVFARSSRLPQGHVAVVSKVLSGREIMVTQANWVRHHVTTDQIVADVSPYGDWSSVRVWWPPTSALGTTVYPVHGFIYSGYADSHDRIAGTVPHAIQVALRN